jgi:sulfite reductase alpha subunit-like flavoprotein
VREWAGGKAAVGGSRLDWMGGRWDAATEKAAGNASGGGGGDGARNPVVGVYFGTQTGTAEQFATDVQARLLKHFSNVDVQVRDLEELGDDGDAAAEHMAATHAALVLCSTYGDGEPPDTTAHFFDWLNKTAADCDGMNAAAMPLAGTNFAVFGLGNTQYEHFNASGKALDTLLERCGGERLMPIALGNDDDDIVEVCCTPAASCAGECRVLADLPPPTPQPSPGCARH